MSFDVFFIPMKNGKITEIPMQETLKAFEGLCELERKVQQGNDGTCIRWETWKWGWVNIGVAGEDENLCSGINVNRPTSDPEFWKIMFELMQKYPLGMVFPTSNLRWILANETFRNDFQTDLPIEIVSTPEELLGTITDD